MADLPWALWRVDDNGSRFLVERFASEAEARASAERFEARAHKQHYWVERAAPESSSDDTSA